LKEFSSFSLLWHVYRFSWSSFLRLLWGKDWWNKLENFPKIRKIRGLPKARFIYYYIRDIGSGLSQSKLPDGSVIQPFDSIATNAEIYKQEVYDSFKRINNDDVVIDVGAHIGIFTLKAAKKARNGMVVAIEPHPFNYKLLRKNIALNRVENVTAVNIALSDFCGTTKLYISERSREHSISRREKKQLRVRTERSGEDTISAKRREMSATVTARYLEVEVKTLDQLVRELKLERVNFIKIDAEGAELEILKGAETTLRENDVFVVAACYHVPQEFQNVCRYLKEIGFKVYSSSEHEYLYGLRKS